MTAGLRAYHVPVASDTHFGSGHPWYTKKADKMQPMHYYVPN
jgi:hypothetical protein